MISNTSIAVATAFVSHYGVAALAGYGVAARLEYILVPIAFGFGTALTAMVATNMGAGQAARALRATWMGAAVVTAITGLIGVAAAIDPSLWMNLFSDDAAVRAFGAQYLRIVGASYGLFGLGLALLFASQGAGRMFWPLVGSAARLAIVVAGGWVCVHVLQTRSERLLRRGRDQSGPLWLDHRRCDQARQLDAIGARRAKDHFEGKKMNEAEVALIVGAGPGISASCARLFSQARGRASHRIVTVQRSAIRSSALSVSLFHPDDLTTAELSSLQRVQSISAVDPDARALNEL